MSEDSIMPRKKLQDWNRMTIQDMNVTSKTWTKSSLYVHNSQGSGCGKFEYINKLLIDSDIVLVQEHWLTENHYNKHLDNVNFHSITPMESGEIINGRQFGGCAIIWKNSLIASIKPISNQSKRVCAVTVKVGASSFFIVQCIHANISVSSNVIYTGN